MFSPDGKLLYFLGNEILIFETENFTQVDKWDLSNLEEGLGQVSISFGGFGGPRQHQRRARLSHDDADGRRSGAAPPHDGRRADQPDQEGSRVLHARSRRRRVNFVLAPDRKHGYGLESSIGRYQFWTFDLDQKRVTTRARVRGPAAHVAEDELERPAPLHLQRREHDRHVRRRRRISYLRTVTLDGDVTTQFYVVPRAAPARP